MSFTSEEGGVYTLSTTYTDAWISLNGDFDMEGNDIVINGAGAYTFTLNEGESISFWFSYYMMNPANYTVTITKVTE